MIGVIVPRWKEVTLEYYDEDGERHIEHFRIHSQARVIQHEQNHVDGILVSDYYNYKKGQDSNMGLLDREKGLY
jgi:peptide deformylase